EFGKGIGGDPNARLGEVDVGEDPQDAPAVRRPAWKGIDMQEIVPRRQTQPPRGFFFRPKTDPVQLPTSAIARQSLSEPFRGRARKAGQQAAQPFGLNGIPPQEAAGFPRTRIVADVFVHSTAELLFQQESAVVSFRQKKWADRKIYDVASFQALFH